ncbi:MAG TPA: lipid-binding SYLF domain-containing protein [Stellaceae bacterium]|nr:lipid-binding SYLF domain-containing protein [Stellaceae bacterium]
MFASPKLVAITLASTLMLSTTGAFAGSDESNLVERARITIDDLKKDKELGNAVELMHHAKGVMIVPSLIKGGFFVGGEGGEGVLLTRGSANGWGNPAFYTLASASFGLQVGLEQAELVVFVMSDKAMAAFMQDEFSIGAQAGLAVGTLGSTGEGATTGALGADIVVWSSAGGAYAGLTLDGSVIKPRGSWNDAYYGHAETVSHIESSHGSGNAGADGLRIALATVR